MAYGNTAVKYDGTDVGPLYLKDIGQRNGLGGGKGIYVRGQDRYIGHLSDTTFISTSDVMLSVTSGVLKHLLDRGIVTVTIIQDANQVL